jgi:3-hydroxyisobutyrate dehydrogenase-like beta-hydroxyacid dehydrogenase
MAVCQAYSAKVIAVSDRPSAANCMKLATNLNVAAAVELISETYVFAEKCGLLLEHMRDFYQQIWFSHPAAQMFAEKLRTRDFAGRGGFAMTGGLKDLRLMLSTASDVNAPLEVGKIIERKLAAGVDSGMGETDWSAIYEISRREAGLK